jgi:hypothetical protein
MGSVVTGTCAKTVFMHISHHDVLVDHPCCGVAQQDAEL